MDAVEAIKNAPTDVLCKAAGTLQKAHDFVEAHGFSMAYGAGEGSTHCCFIGSVRQAAGEHTYGPSEHPASELALAALDVAARARGYRGRSYKGDCPNAGGIAEATIVFDNDGKPRVGGILEKPVALETYRQALREMHTELMNRQEAA